MTNKKERMGQRNLFSEEGVKEDFFLKALTEIRNRLDRIEEVLKGGEEAPAPIRTGQGPKSFSEQGHSEEQTYSKMEWIVVKYMKDMRRRETQNVGIILRKGNEYRSRFFAMEGEDLNYDLAASRSIFPDNYHAWVAYLQHRLEKVFPSLKDSQSLLEILKPSVGVSNYVLEAGGETLYDGRGVDIDLKLDELYQLLVA